MTRVAEGFTCTTFHFTNNCPDDKLLLKVGVGFPDEYEGDVMDKEQQIVNHIKINPYISQQELAEKVGLSRSAVANYIANLTKRGVIKGRAYILGNEHTILCVGGANIDRKAKTKEDVRFYSSNPVTIREACGGVARNVAENLRMLDCNVSLLSAVGEDKEGEWLLADAKRKGIDVSSVWQLPAERTGSYTALLNGKGEMVVSMADMHIYERVSPEMLEEKWPHFMAAQAVFLDTNLPSVCIESILMRCSQQHIPVFIDPVSSAKASKLPADLTAVDVLLPNREEAEVLAGMRIESLQDCQQACRRLHDRGVNRVVITRGVEGVYYSAAEGSGHLPSLTVEPVDVTGAGDAFAAALIYGLLQNESLMTACRLGLAAASLTLQTEHSVQPTYKR